MAIVAVGVVEYKKRAVVGRGELQQCRAAPLDIGICEVGGNNARTVAVDVAQLRQITFVHGLVDIVGESEPVECTRDTERVAGLCTGDHAAAGCGSAQRRTS